jgi:hypothetical protein
LKYRQKSINEDFSEGGGGSTAAPPPDGRAEGRGARGADRLQEATPRPARAWAPNVFHGPSFRERAARAEPTPPHEAKSRTIR